jgi:hypothetical protein
MTFQSAFEATMQAVKINSEDMSESYEVRQYAKTIFMLMQAQAGLIEYQEQEAAEKLIEFFNQ